MPKQEACARAGAGRLAHALEQAEVVAAQLVGGNRRLVRPGFFRFAGRGPGDRDQFLRDRPGGEVARRQSRDTQHPVETAGVEMGATVGDQEIDRVLPDVRDDDHESSRRRKVREQRTQERRRVRHVLEHVTHGDQVVAKRIGDIRPGVEAAHAGQRQHLVLAHVGDFVAVEVPLRPDAMKALEQVAVRAADVEKLARRRQVDQAEQIFEQDFRARAAAERRVEQARLFARGLVIDLVARVDVLGEAAPIGVEHLLDSGAARAHRPSHARVERLHIGGNEAERSRGGVHRIEPGRIADMAGSHGES